MLVENLGCEIMYFVVDCFENIAIGNRQGRERVLCDSGAIWEKNAEF
jgi:hypothetical protein